MSEKDPQPMPEGDHGQEPPSDDYPVRQRHQIGEPEGTDDGDAETPPK